MTTSDVPTSSQPTTTPPATAGGDEIVAKPGTYYRNTRWLMFALLIGWGGWFLYDGYIGYPKANARIEALSQQIQTTSDPNQAARLKEEQKKLGSPHQPKDMALQKMLGYALPPLGVFVLYRMLRNTRGNIRLEGQTLHVPGHPPVPFDSITALDQRLWDKKGIAYVDYTLPDNRSGQITLDDFVYDRPPIDAMYERIRDYLSPPEAAGAPAASESPSPPTSESSSPTV